jgi:hypothetical protein
MGNVIDIDIHVHLDKFHPPDATGTTDYVAFGLVCAYAFIALAGNLMLARIASEYKPIEAVNIWLVYAMSFFSLCHMMCVYVDMYYWPEVSEAVQRFSCVATAFWGEYFVGIGGFLSVLGVRAFSLQMVSYDILRPRGPQYRRTLLKCIVFALFLMPIYGICLLITVDERSEFAEALRGCDTPAGYKFGLVGVLASYIVVLTLQGVSLAASDLNTSWARPILGIIWVAIPLLLAASVVHFMYMLPHYWGRLAFMCIAFALHTFAYLRITLPGFLDYRAFKRSEALTVPLELDAFDGELPDRSYSHRPSPTFKDSPVATKISKDVAWLMETVDPTRPTMTPEILMRIDELRGGFFNHCKTTHSAIFFSYDSNDELHEVDPEETADVLCIPVYRLINFYNDVHNTYVITQKTHSLQVERNANAVYNLVAPRIQALTQVYLSALTTSPINLPARMVGRLKRGFAHGPLSQWDVPVLREIMLQVLSALMAADDGDYNMLFRNALEKLLERSGVTLFAMREENVATLAELVPDETFMMQLDKWLKLIKKGRFNKRAEDDSRDDADDVGGERAHENDVDEMLQPAQSGESRDEFLEGGAVIYSSPSRALFYFLYDACACVLGVATCLCRRSSTTSSHLDTPDDDALVVHTIQN